jgi:hypothetical protein
MVTAKLYVVSGRRSVQLTVMRTAADWDIRAARLAGGELLRPQKIFD